MRARLAPETPFIVVTRAIGDEAAVGLLKAGADDYVLKNRLDRLSEAVAQALHERIVRRQEVELHGRIARAKQEWERAIDMVQDAILLLDDSHTVLRVNRSAARLLSQEPGALVGRKCDECFLTMAAGGGHAMLSAARRSGQTQHGELEDASMGSRFEVTVSPVLRTDGALQEYLVILHDVSERSRLEAQLHQAQKMESVGRLAGGIAHDFNNLLMLIRGYSEMMLDRLAPGDPLHRNAEEIQKAADRAAALTQQLLAFSRKQILAPKRIDIRRVVEDAEKMLRRLLGGEIELRILRAPEGCEVNADPGQIEQVLMNLAQNARDAMPRGGRLVIETQHVTLTDADMRQAPGLRPGPYVHLSVSDTGSGMDEQTRQRIFEPFFTTKGIGRGTGLGLATVYGIVKQSGGHIAVQSEVDKGSTFRVYLPRAEGTPAAERPSSNPSATGDGRDTILLVEDERPVRELTRQFLELNGYCVLEAKDGPDALRVADGYSGRIQMLVADVMMPGISGPEVSRQLLQRRPETKVLYVSGYAGDAIPRGRNLEAGAHFLQKPFKLEELARKLREILAPSKQA